MRAGAIAIALAPAEPGWIQSRPTARVAVIAERAVTLDA